MASMTNSMPMPIGIPSSSNSAYQFPCLPLNDFKNQKEPPHVNDQEFKECMQAKINQISLLNNQSRAFFDKMKMDKSENCTIKFSTEEERELINQFFDILDKNKV